MSRHSRISASTSSAQEDPPYDKRAGTRAQRYDCVNMEMSDPDYHNAVRVAVKRKE